MNKKILFSAFCACLFAKAAFGAAANLPADGFSAPVGMLCMDDGSMLVAEWGANRVTRLDASGKRQAALGGISSPAGMARDPGGAIYIAGYGDGNIYVWDGQGKPKILAGGFHEPTGLLWTKDNTLLVANRGAGTVEQVDETGKRKIISQGHSLPVGIAQTGDGSLFVSCYGGTLDLIGADGRIRKIKNGLTTPGVGIWPAGRHTVFVVDNGAGRVVEAGADGVIRILAENLPSPVGLAGTFRNEVMAATWGDGKIQMLEMGNE